MNIGGPDGQEAMTARCKVMADALKAALQVIAEFDAKWSALVGTQAYAPKADSYDDLRAILSDPAVVKAIEGK